MSKECIYGWCIHNREGKCEKPSTMKCTLSNQTNSVDFEDRSTNTSTKYRLSREDYKRIKHYSKEEMERFLAEFYVEAYNTGVTKLSNSMFSKIDSSIKKVKGIGEKRIAEFYNHLQESLKSTN